MKIPGFTITIQIGQPQVQQAPVVDLKQAAREMLKGKKLAPVGKKKLDPPFDVNEDPYPKLTQSKNEPSPKGTMKEKPKRGYYY